MSTKNIEGLDEMRDSLRVTAASVQERAIELEKEVRQRRRKMVEDDQHAEIVRRLLAQDHVDHLDVLREEHAQLDGILGNTPEPTKPPASSEDEVDEDEPTAVRRRVPTPAPEPTPVQTEPEPEQHHCCHGHDTVVHDRPVRVINVWGVRNWSVLQWLLAVLGLIVFLAISVNTTGVFDDVNTDWLHDTLVVLWVVLMSVFGFFAGGLIGALIDERHRSPQVTT